jgi:hypothetical protein
MLFNIFLFGAYMFYLLPLELVHAWMMDLSLDCYKNFFFNFTIDVEIFYVVVYIHLRLRLFPKSSI